MSQNGGFGPRSPRWSPGLQRVAIVVAVLAIVASGAFATTLVLTGSPAITPSPVSSPLGEASGSPSPSAVPSERTTEQPTDATPERTPSPMPTGPTSSPATPTETTKPTAAPTARPTNTATAAPAGPSVLVTSGPTSGKQVALTFDMGGRVDPALDIYDYLASAGVHATIFFTGAIVDSPNTDAGRTVLADVCAQPSQFAFGNHSYSHPSFTDLTATRIREELQKTEQSMAKFCPTSPRPFFRPPNGAYNAAVLQAVGAAGYSRTIYWSIDTLDWAAPDDPNGRYQTAAMIVANVEAHVTSGSIVLMHMGGYNTLPAIKILVPWLRSQGYQLVNLRELLGV